MYVPGTRLRRLIVLTLVVIAQPFAHAQDNTGAAEVLLRAAYADLFNEPVGMRVIAESPPGVDHSSLERFPEVTVQFDRARPKMPATAEENRAQLLNVFLLIDRFAQIHDLRAAGTYVHSTDSMNMVAFADGHSKMSDDALIIELERRGARFTRDVSEVSRVMDLQRFEPSLGLIVKRDIEFEVRHQEADPIPRDAFEFLWRVKLQTRPTPGESQCFVLDFEPFDGRLTRLLRLFSCD